MNLSSVSCGTKYSVSMGMFSCTCVHNWKSHKEKRIRESCAEQHSQHGEMISPHVREHQSHLEVQLSFSLSLSSMFLGKWPKLLQCSLFSGPDRLMDITKPAWDLGDLSSIPTAGTDPLRATLDKSSLSLKTRISSTCEGCNVLLAR